ncbi:hypothetical protein HDU93_004157 [Gonapodya sp. JEL0774]|nr:hypothetical protein HDU93_004157 [Gonapodya sp. JEL0774]
MAIFHPTRGGTRGGQDQFKWEDVKDDKHRENYLGHSLLAPVGRWQRNRDLTWYAKEESAKSVVTRAQIEADELRKFKEAEAEALAEALGYKGPKKHLDPTRVANISKSEMDKLVKAEGEADPMDAEMVKQSEATKVKGIGFGRLRNLDVNLGRQIVEHVPGKNTESATENSGSGPSGDYVPIASARSGAGKGKTRTRSSDDGDDGSDSEAASERKKRKKKDKEEQKQRKKEKREKKERKAERGLLKGNREHSKDRLLDRRGDRRRESPPHQRSSPVRRRHDSDSEEERKSAPADRKDTHSRREENEKRDYVYERRHTIDDRKDQRRDVSADRVNYERNDRTGVRSDRWDDRRSERRDRDERGARGEHTRDRLGREDERHGNPPKRLYSPEPRRFERR